MVLIITLANRRFGWSLECQWSIGTLTVADGTTIGGEATADHD